MNYLKDYAEQLADDNDTTVFEIIEKLIRLAIEDRNNELYYALDDLRSELRQLVDERFILLTISA